MTDELVSNVTQGRFLEHLDYIRRLATMDRDCVIIITGPERAGKSGLADVAAELLDAGFTPDLQVHWSGASYAAAAVRVREERKVPLNTCVVMVHDELVRGGASYEFMTEQNKDFAQFLTVCGYLRIVHLLIMPSRKWISPIIREHRAWFEWRVVKRYKDHAVAKVYQLRDDNGVFDKPRLLFTFTYPKPAGAKWQRILRLKDEFARNVGRGTADTADLFKAEKARMIAALRRLVAQGWPHGAA